MGRWSTIKDPTTFSERSQTARMCSETVRFRFPALVDSMDDRTAIRWAAWPERLFVIDRKGIVVYAGGQGPWDFWPTARYRKINSRKGQNREKPSLSLEEFLESYLHPGMDNR